ncbi:hypothetical protein NFJ02_15g22400 [Pycnococcus provasolii]
MPLREHLVRLLATAALVLVSANASEEELSAVAVPNELDLLRNNTSIFSLNVTYNATSEPDRLESVELVVRIEETNATSRCLNVSLSETLVQVEDVSGTFAVQGSVLSYDDGNCTNATVIFDADLHFLNNTEEIIMKDIGSIAVHVAAEEKNDVVVTPPCLVVDSGSSTAGSFNVSLLQKPRDDTGTLVDVLFAEPESDFRCKASQGQLNFTRSDYATQVIDVTCDLGGVEPYEEARQAALFSVEAEPSESFSPSTSPRFVTVYPRKPRLSLNHSGDTLNVLTTEAVNRTFVLNSPWSLTNARVWFDVDSDACVVIPEAGNITAEPSEDTPFVLAVNCTQPAHASLRVWVSGGESPCGDDDESRPATPEAVVHIVAGEADANLECDTPKIVMDWSKKDGGAKGAASVATVSASLLAEPYAEVSAEVLLQSHFEGEKPRFTGSVSPKSLSFSQSDFGAKQDVTLTLEWPDGALPSNKETRCGGSDNKCTVDVTLLFRGGGYAIERTLALVVEEKASTPKRHSSIKGVVIGCLVGIAICVALAASAWFVARARGHSIESMADVRDMFDRIVSSARRLFVRARSGGSRGDAETPLLVAMEDDDDVA